MQVLLQDVRPYFEKGQHYIWEKQEDVLEIGPGIAYEFHGQIFQHQETGAFSGDLLFSRPKQNPLAEKLERDVSLRELIARHGCFPGKEKRHDQIRTRRDRHRAIRIEFFRSGAEARQSKNPREILQALRDAFRSDVAEKYENRRAL
jgi:hypothetical protein